MEQLASTPEFRRKKLAFLVAFCVNILYALFVRVITSFHQTEDFFCGQDDIACMWREANSYLIDVFLILARLLGLPIYMFLKNRSPFLAHVALYISFLTILSIPSLMRILKLYHPLLLTT